MWCRWAAGKRGRAVWFVIGLLGVAAIYIAGPKEKADDDREAAIAASWIRERGSVRAPLQ